MYNYFILDPGASRPRVWPAPDKPISGESGEAAADIQ